MLDFRVGDFVWLPQEPYRVVVDIVDLTIVRDRAGNILVAPRQTELAWRPKFKGGDEVWHRRWQQQGVVQDASALFTDNEGYYRVVFEQGQEHSVKESSLVPYTKQDQEEPSMEFAYSHFVVDHGQRNPRTMLYQLAANKLADVTGNEAIHAGETDDPLGVDGIAGRAFNSSASAVQVYFDLSPVDKIIGKNTWRAMTSALGSWRPPLRLRIAEQQNNFENGNRANAFGAYNKVSFEGWHNYGVWNVNCMDGNMAGSSLGTMLAMAGRKDLWQHNPASPATIAGFLTGPAGRKVQLYDYMDKYIVQPAIDNLNALGFDLPFQLARDMPDTLDPFEERLLALACDMSVNSGPVGMFGSRFPWVWDGTGVLEWDDQLPDQDQVISIYEEVYDLKVQSKTGQTQSDRFSRAVAKQALRRCMGEACQTDEERINLLADMQARCVPPRSTGGGETLQELVVRRRRCVGRLGGYRFQGAHYNTPGNFGIGVP